MAAFAVPQQERQQALLGLPLQVLHVFARPRQVAQRFLRAIRHTYRRQLARPVQPRQHQAVAPVGLDPVARFLRNQGWRDHLAIPAEVGELPVDAVSTWPGLVAER